MPIYEYKCMECQKDFDKITSCKTPDSDIKCPACGKNTAKKKLSKFSFGSKGSGGDFKAAPAGGGGCSSCSGGSCSGCH